MAPTRLRKKAESADDKLDSAQTSTLRLSYRAPYDWVGILSFLRTRMLNGAEWVTDDTYYRTVQLGKHQGWLAVSHAPEKNALLVEFTHSLTPVLPALLGRLRNLFDLSARPDLISTHLMQDSMLERVVAKNPGLRVPGAFDGFELAVRAVLGQQVTVKAATTLACRFVEAFGGKIETPFPELNRLSPLPERILSASVDDIAKLGIIRTRATSISALAQAAASETLQLHVGADPDKTMAQLTAIPGIGQWTAHYVAMRALRWSDAFPKEDIIIRKNLGNLTAKQAEVMSQKWRPWRSYAVLHIWKNPDDLITFEPEKQGEKRC
jgi:AraC family transcriptional regulator of adaptative response / DNA-3-methyladenine glycosylase II